ncbi:hypothetical protein CYMTET_36758 [Cymbomonas tetramitiformis]|uniref:Uncharacterized protein n=1 Tax=Cymbomonas tetramitiformis TaxID=36881 RepID=A0AAE0CGP8_9CHLO|nr:hypothetical protein CYMTET_36758 [Cymbomonas tetramitiformis]
MLTKVEELCVILSTCGKLGRARERLRIFFARPSLGWVCASLGGAAGGMAMAVGTEDLGADLPDAQQLQTARQKASSGDAGKWEGEARR